MAKLSGDLNTSGVEFLIMEVQTGITFADAAAEADGPVEMSRDRVNAQAAYDNGLRYLDRVTLSPEAANVLKEKMSELKSKLDELQKTGLTRDTRMAE